MPRKWREPDQNSCAHQTRKPKERKGSITKKGGPPSSTKCMLKKNHKETPLNPNKTVPTPLEAKTLHTRKKCNADSKECEEGSKTETTPPTRRELQESIQNADKTTQAMTIPLPPSRSPFPAPTLSLLSPVGPVATQSTLWSCPAALAARS